MKHKVYLITFLIAALPLCPFRAGNVVARAYQGDCPGALPPRLSVKSEGRAISDDLIKVNIRPSLSEPSVIGLENGDEFSVIGGPQCVQAPLVIGPKDREEFSIGWWWQIVTTGGLTGWVAESLGDKYLIEPTGTLVPDPLPSPIARLAEHHPDRSPTSMSWSPDGQTLAIINVEGIWLYTANLKQQQLLAAKSIQVLAWSPDGKMLAGGRADGTISLWNIPSGNRRVLSGHPNGVLDLTWRPDGTRLVSVSSEPLFRVWNPATGESVAAPTLPMVAAAVDWQPGGSGLIILYHQKLQNPPDQDEWHLDLWDGNTLTLQMSIDDAMPSTALDQSPAPMWSPNGKLLMLSYRGTFYLWDSSTHTARGVDANLAGNGWVSAYTWAGDSQHVIWVTANVAIGPADTGGGSTLHSGAVGQKTTSNRVGTDNIHGIAWRPGTDELTTLSGRQVELWGGIPLTKRASVNDFENAFFSQAPIPQPAYVKEIEGALRGKDRFGNEISYLVAWSPDWSHLVAWMRGGRNLVIFEANKISVKDGVWPGLVAMTIPPYDEKIFGDDDLYFRTALLAWSPDNTRLAGTVGWSPLLIWDALTGAKVTRMSNCSMLISNPAWSPDGSRLAASSYSRIYVWDAKSGRLQITQETPGFEVVANLLWKADGTQLVTVGSIGSVSIWNMQD